MTISRLLLTSALAATSALAHCQLAWPYALHSALNPATPEALKDYSMTSPLVTDGTYPCKGFINNPSSAMGSVVTWDAGSSINYTIAGTATHGGGSCQISMSYDNGTTWNVIFSYVGGCLIEGMTQEITIPSEAPSGEALFAWDWFNLQGNREMYHNCASVTITNGGDGFNDDDFPTPFVANAGTDINDCVTVENTAVVFPNPGKTVKYGGSYASSKPTTPAGFTGTNCIGPGASSSSSNSSSASSSASTSASSSSSSSVSTAAAATTTTADSFDSTSTSSASSSHTTLWSVTLDESNTSLTTDEASASAASSVATTSSSASTCRSKRSRRVSRRHERLVPQPRSDLRVTEEARDEKRVAASKATHNKGKRDGGRVAASKATHNLKRGEKRVAASKATHNTSDAGKRANGRVAASRASHMEQKRRQGLKEMFGLFHS